MLETQGTKKNAVVPEQNLDFMRLIDEQHTREPFHDKQRVMEWLRQQGMQIGQKSVTQLLHTMGLSGIYSVEKMEAAESAQINFPYLLNGLSANRPNQVWCSDITYVRLQTGFVYLVVVMDWFSRCILAWRLSSSQSVGFCLDALNEALVHGRPEIFNGDESSPCAHPQFTQRLIGENILIRMNGPLGLMDTVFIEDFWRQIKYEEIYLKEYASIREAFDGVGGYIQFYNNERAHQALGYRTPSDLYFGAKKIRHSFQGGMDETRYALANNTARAVETTSNVKRYSRSIPARPPLTRSSAL